MILPWGSSGDCTHHLVGDLVIWKPAWAGHPRWLVHMADSWYWLSCWELSRSCQPSTYTWLFHVTWSSSSMASGFWELMFQEEVTKDEHSKGPRQKLQIFSFSLEVISLTSVANQSLRPPDSRIRELHFTS